MMRIERFFGGGIAAFLIAKWVSISKEKQFKISEAENNYRYLFESAPDGIDILDKNGTLVDCNNTVSSLLGYSREELIGKHFTEIMTEKSARLFKDKFSAFKSLHKCEGRIELMRKDGKNIDIWRKAVPLVDSADKFKGVLGFNRDITNEVELKFQLAHTQRIEIIGTLAGGIAHDFNNILSPIIGYSEMAIMDVPENSKLSKNLHAILAAANRARDLVKQILTFSRQNIQELRPLEIQPVIKEVLGLLRSSLPTTIEIVQHIDNDCGLILADVSQIHQVVMNLCTNAFHAMEDTEGRIEVDLTDVELKADDLNGMHIEPGSYLCLRVADNGSGIEEAVIDKIFDPYFTTKDKSKGTGLGLSVVHGIVENYGGDVKVYSEPGKGTEFNVYLPETGNNSVLPEIELCDILPGNNERVLLVDDQPEVLEIEQHMLDRLGYQVTVRSSSLEAMELFHAKPDEFDVVITDMTMPNMTGDKLAGKITKIRSDIPVILCTGFSERMSQGNAHSPGISEFIMKPVALEKLSKTLRKVLNKA